jgi:hypothetical protein
MRKIIIETDDQTYAAAISGLCFCGGYTQDPEVTDLAEIAIAMENFAKAKLVSMIGQTIEVDQRHIASNAVLAALTAMNGSTSVTVE